MTPSLYRLLPRVLYRLGQVAATPAMALPVLEFLSGLVPVPALYSGFVEQQYLSVFGIALPYTDPHKYGNTCSSVPSSATCSGESVAMATATLCPLVGCIKSDI